MTTTTVGNIDEPQEEQQWYRPELGDDIPNVPLTRANRARIAARDEEIVKKEAEMEEVMKVIAQRK